MRSAPRTPGRRACTAPHTCDAFSLALRLPPPALVGEGVTAFGPSASWITSATDSEHTWSVPRLSARPAHSAGAMEGQGPLRQAIAEARAQKTNLPHSRPGTLISLRNHELLKPWKIIYKNFKTATCFSPSSVTILVIHDSFDILSVTLQCPSYPHRILRLSSKRMNFSKARVSP